MKNIQVIPTDKPSRLILQINGKLRLSAIVFRGQVASGITQHIYITSDSEIKIGDWYLNGVIPTNERINKSRGTNVASFYKSKDVKKIILTTDQDLINDGIQGIDDEFLEWFVQNPSCEEVEVEEIHLCTQTGLPCGMQCLSEETCNENISYKIIIPKEEPKQDVFQEMNDFMFNSKQETLEEYATRCDEYSSQLEKETVEEVAEKLVNRPYGNVVSKSSFIEGAKWQQEQDKKCYHPMTERKHTSDVHFECTICGYNNY